MCPCHNTTEYALCCQPYHTAAALSTTAEQLMRSRYSAYVTGHVEYLIQTTHPSTRHFHRRADLLHWSTSNAWLRLEILASRKDFVHFKAYFRDSEGHFQVHEEKSRFKKEHGKWYYLDAEY